MIDELVRLDWHSHEERNAGQRMPAGSFNEASGSRPGFKVSIADMKGLIIDADCHGIIPEPDSMVLARPFES